MKIKGFITIFSITFFFNTIYAQAVKRNFIRADYNCLTNSISTIHFYKDSVLKSSISNFKDGTQYTSLYNYNLNNQLIKIVEYEHGIIVKEKKVEIDSAGKPVSVKIVDHAECKNSKKCVIKKDKDGNIVEIKEYSDIEKKHLIVWYKFFYSHYINYEELTKILQ